MRFSQLFGQTLRDTPAGTENPGISLLIRAGFVQALGNGDLALLPPGRRTLTRIEAMLRAELNAIGGQEISMPPGRS
jgi:prolyl-tRNA synthetase